MAAGAHFGCQKFTFDRISGHFRSIRNLHFEIFDKMAAVAHFGCLKFTFDSNSGHFRSIFFFGGHFGCPKITFDCISDRLAILDIRNSLSMAFWRFQIHADRNYYFKFLTKWPPAAILDGTTMSIIKLVRGIWMSNACVKFEECSLNPSKVIALTTKL